MHGLTVRKTWHIILINTYCLILNLLLKIVCSFDERQQWLQWRQHSAIVAAAIFPHSRSLFISFSEILIAPLCNILLTHAHIHSNIGIYWVERLQLFNTVIVLFIQQYTNDCYTDLYFSFLFFHHISIATDSYWISLKVQFNINIRVLSNFKKSDMNWKFC